MKVVFGLIRTQMVVAQKMIELFVTSIWKYSLSIKISEVKH